MPLQVHSDPRLLELLMRRFPFGAFLTLDDDLRYTSAGGQGLADAGLAPEDIVGRTIYEMWPESVWKVIEAPYRAALRGEEAEVEVDWGDSTYINWVAPLPGDEKGIVLLTWDVTSRSRAESELRLIQEAVSALHVGLSIADASDPEMPLIYVSRGFEQVTGYPRDEVLGRNCRFLQGPETDPAQVRVLSEAVRDGRDAQVTLLNYRRDGEPFWNRLTITPIRDGSGEITHYVGIQEDVTRHRELGERLQVRERLSAVGQLAGGVAHDIRNVLTGVGGILEMSLLRDLDADLRADLEEAKSVLERASSVTDRLLAFSRNRSMHAVPLELNELVCQQSEFLAKVVRESVHLRTELAEGESWVSADPGQLDQVLINLIKNAEDALPEGGEVTLITARDDEAMRPFRGLPDVEDVGPAVRLTVRDEGIGMTDEELSRALEPFYTTKGSGRGTGLGLASVYGTVTQLGGRVRLESKPGQGTSVHMLLPLTDERPAEQASPASPVQGRSGRVLVVEDEAAVRRMCRQALELDGHEVVTATDGLDGWERFFGDADRFDLLITDAVMPRLSGVELIRRVRDRRPDVPIILMTGYTDEEIDSDAPGGRLELLEKPFQLEEIRLAARRMLARR